VDDFRLAIGRSEKGVDWHEQKANLVILMISPVSPGSPQLHMELMKQIAVRLRETGLDGVMSAESPEELAAMLGLVLEGS
jgi:mannitol/fructose-specific phosphotransferase system IIA component (Ntr-type)